MTFEELVKYARDNECSDIHITVGTNLAIRRFGTLMILDDVPTADESTPYLTTTILLLYCCM